MNSSEVNRYSPQWFDFFHVGIPEARTAQESAFICVQAPLPGFRRVLDVCCGMGRHARALSALGYTVIGVERDETAMARARELGGGPSYVQADVRDYRPEPGCFDAVMIMSQSFGLFDPEGNRDLLFRLVAALRSGGRVILDLWNPDFFAAHEGQRNFELPGGTVRETKSSAGDRLSVRLEYPGQQGEDFVWQLFTPEQMRSLAGSIGLKLALACTDFDSAVAPDPAKPRIQFVLERRI